MNGHTLMGGRLRVLCLSTMALLGACASPLAQFEARVRNDQARGWNINRKNAEGQPLLHEIVSPLYQPVDTARVRVLLEAGLDPNGRDDDGNTPLHLYWSDQQVAIQTLLIAAGSDPNARNKWGWTPLHCCADATGFEGLIAAGADPNARDDDGDTPLHMAADGVLDDLLALLSAGADLEARNDAGKTALHEAASVRWYAERARPLQARTLIRAGADVEARDTLGRTPLHVAMYWESSSAQDLISAGTDPNARDNAGQTPLHHYVGALNPPRVDPSAMLDPLLLAGGVLDAQDSTRRSPLHLVRDTVRLAVLVAAGADPGLADADGRTPLHWHWRSEIILQLHRAQADPNARDHGGRTPLHWAAAGVQTRTGRTLLGRDDSGEPRWSPGTPVSPDWIRTLLSIGAYPTARDTLGATPLHYLARESGPETGTTAADILLQAGADPNARDDSGRTPLDYIEQRSPLWWRLSDLRGETGSIPVTDRRMEP